MDKNRKVSPRSRDFGLDVIRATAILLVLITHSTVFFKSHNWFTFGPLPAFGLLGVELFFGLSGYLIGMILLEGRHSLGVFYLKRLMKILPPYLFILGVVFITSGVDNWRAFAVHLLFIQTFYPAQANYFPVSWSLAIEFWFYLFAPLLLINRVTKKNIGTQLLKQCVTVVALLFVIRAIYIMSGKHDWEFGVHRFMPLRFDTLIFGIIAAAIARQHKDLRLWLTTRLITATAIAACGVFCVLFGLLYYHATLDSARWFHVLGLSVLGCSIMVLVLVALKYPSPPIGTHVWLNQ